MPTGERTGGAIRPLSSREFDRIRELAYRSFGLDLKPGKEELVSARLQRLLKGGDFRTFEDYYEHVTHDSTGRALAALIDALATNHTSFLRESDHFRFLRDKVIPELMGHGALEIWSAACATGEEIWTLAFLLNDALPGRSIQIHASDISNKALESAARAEYSAERCLTLPSGWVSRYMIADGQPATRYRVAPKIKQQARFRRLNLVEKYDWPRAYPVVFCRNVMIYFDRATQQRVVGRIADFLEPGGYLFIGHAESLSGIAHCLEYVQPAVYRKPRQGANR